MSKVVDDLLNSVQPIADDAGMGFYFNQIRDEIEYDRMVRGLFSERKNYPIYGHT